MPRRIRQVVPGARPFPIDGSAAQATLHGIVVDVIERCLDGGREQIAVEPRTLLPKSKTRLGQHDPLDGLITFLELQAMAAIADMTEMCAEGDFATEGRSASADCSMMRHV